MKYLFALLLFTQLTLFAQTENFSGTYRFGKDINKENIGKILVYQTSKNKAYIYISTTKKAPSFNTSQLLTEVEIIDHKASYQAKSGSAKVSLHFKNNSVFITDFNNLASLHVFLQNKEFKKVDANTRTFFYNGAGEKINLNKEASDYLINYFPNTPLWDFVGIWNFGDFSETIQISKDLASEKINIKYNSVHDGFEDRYFENCYYKNGRIYGDFYGGEKNVVIEIEDGNLKLTINPFHKFSPIQQQTFKKYPTSVFKYFVGEENDKTPQKGKRLMVNSKQNTPNYDALTLYNDLKCVTPYGNSNIQQVPSNKLSDIKPLLTSESSLYNSAEKMGLTLYDEKKLIEKTTIIKYNAQNIKGEKKLLVDKKAFEKLQLKNIGNYFSSIYITGTVDLSDKFKTLSIDIQYENEYHTYLVNYSKQGKYIDHIKIGYNDYIESFTPTTASFPPGEVYVEKKIYFDDGNSFYRYKTYNGIRYILNEKGIFIESNYLKREETSIKKSFKAFTQNIQNKNNGNGTISLILNYNSDNHDVTSLSTEITTESGMIKNIPIDLSKEVGFDGTPEGSFKKPIEYQTLETLYGVEMGDKDINRLRLKMKLIDLNEDNVEELVLEITDGNYVYEPTSYFLFEQNAGSWVLNTHNKEANKTITTYDFPSEVVFKSFLINKRAPFYYPVKKEEKKKLLLKENEALIYSFKLKNSAKRVTIGVDKNKAYVFYRFGKPDAIELEYLKKREDKLKDFNYFLIDFPSTPPRDYAEHLSFVNHGFEYAIYINYLETSIQYYYDVVYPKIEYSNGDLKDNLKEGIITDEEYDLILYVQEELKFSDEMPEKEGIGIMVRDIKTNKKTFIEADTETLIGKLGYFKFF
ncbi:hypothetical protein OAX11_02170 [Flavobacteriaceae bacterium]|nr:hypothetical protein [Flavobacteriaceae bacterium]